MPEPFPMSLNGFHVDRLLVCLQPKIVYFVWPEDIEDSSQTTVDEDLDFLCGSVAFMIFGISQLGYRSNCTNVVCFLMQLLTSVCL